MPKTKKHHATMPQEPILAIFYPLKDFTGATEDGQFLGHYKKGRPYYLREGNAVLPPLLQKWEAEKLIAIT